MRLAACRLPLAACGLRLAACGLRLAACGLRLAACGLRQHHRASKSRRSFLFARRARRTMHPIDTVRTST
ncbi:hypothetical protein C6T53_27410 [Burkholderia multivorans]|nr:hypothetical protein C6T53_27410 [Burkholderia multivorans]